MDKIPDGIKRKIIETRRDMQPRFNDVADSKIFDTAAEFGYLLAIKRITELEEGLTNLMDAIPKQSEDMDWWEDNLTDAYDKAHQLLSTSQSTQ